MAHDASRNLEEISNRLLEKEKPSESIRLWYEDTLTKLSKKTPSTGISSQTSSKSKHTLANGSGILNNFHHSFLTLIAGTRHLNKSARSSLITLVEVDTPLPASEAHATLQPSTQANTAILEPLSPKNSPSSAESTQFLIYNSAKSNLEVGDGSIQSFMLEQSSKPSISDSASSLDSSPSYNNTSIRASKTTMPSEDNLRAELPLANVEATVSTIHFPLFFSLLIGLCLRLRQIFQRKSICMPLSVQ